MPDPELAQEIFKLHASLCSALADPRRILLLYEIAERQSCVNELAARLGIRAGPIEGPTHLSQFVPLLANVWGRDWFERGCFSAHFLNMVFEGEAVGVRAAELADKM